MHDADVLVGVMDALRSGEDTRGTSQQRASGYVPNTIAFSGKVAPYRYIAIRELVRQGVLPGMEESDCQMDLPFATVICNSLTYRVKGIVTNRDLGVEFHSSVIYGRGHLDARQSREQGRDGRAFDPSVS